VVVKYLSRKFILTVIALFGGLWLVYTGKPIMELTAYMTVVLGFYQGASVYEKTQLRKLEGNKNGNSTED
jgi:uncharacterized protein involved in exopolysaccharide biosynthesis